jgi:class 3 adenylate cyclase/tetratricopeptide (TPR) repeat protein
VLKCSACGARRSQGAAFCDECGAPLEARCPSCGETNRAAARFCRACGHRFSRGAAPAPIPTPAHLADKILRSRGALEGERKQVTVLFADMKGSMELLADRDPEEARRILDPVLERMVEAVHHFEGTVNQVMGDGIMALFGAPLAHEDHAIRACLAALRMQEAVARHARQAAGGQAVAIRVGLNSGDVVVRAIRSDLHVDYTAVGHTTHLAARMEQLAPPGGIIASASTVRLAEGYVEVLPRGEVRVKGLEAPVDVFEVVGVGALQSRLQAAAARGLTPLVDREPELAALERAWDEAGAGRGAAVTLVGEAGVGKSRLLQEFLGRVRGRGALVLESDPATWEQSTPYAAVIDLLKRYAGIERDDLAADVRRKLAVRVVGLEKSIEEAVPALLALLDALADDAPFKTVEPRRRRHLTHRALARLVVAESRRRPVVLVFENVHWIDAESQAALDAIVERLGAARVLLLLAGRPGLGEPWAGRPAHSRIELSALSEAHARTLLDTLLGRDADLEPLKRLLVARTEGNPFFLEESVRSLAETQVLIGAPGGYGLSRPVETVHVPATVQATVAARIDRLATGDKHLLQSAAIIGRDVSVGLLATIAEVPDDTVRGGLRDLAAAGLVHETRSGPDAEYRFAQTLTHQVAYESVLLERRRALHGRIVEALEARGGERAGEDVERLAHHAWLGEVWTKAARYLRLAAIKATGRSANADAVAALERALDALARVPETPESLAEAIDVRLELRPPLLQLGRLEDVLARSKEAERLAHAVGDDRRLGSVYSYLVNYHYLKGEPEVALGYGQRCAALAERAGDSPLGLLASRYMAQIHHATGDYRRARELFTTTLAEMDAAPGGRGDEDPQAVVARASASAWLAFTLAELGEFTAARQAAERAREVADAGHQPYAVVMARTFAGLVALRQGEVETAIDLLRPSLEACREKGLTVWEPIPSSLLGLAISRLGRKHEGLALLEAGVTLTERLEVRACLALWTLHLAEGLLLAGEVDRAGRVADRALALSLDHRERGHEAWARWLGAEILARGDGAYEAIASGYRAALDRATALDMRPLVARCHFGLGQLARRRGDRPRAEEHLAQALSLSCEMEMVATARAVREEIKALGRLLVVARDRARLYGYLMELGSADDGLRLVLDRRAGPREMARAVGQSERREARDITARLELCGLAVVA